MPDLINIRASSLPGLADCGYRWYTENILKLRRPSNGKATLGTAVHRGTAVWDSAVLEGKLPSLSDAMEVAHDAVSNPGYGVEWEEDESPAEVARIAQDLTHMYVETIAPQLTFAAVEAKCEGLAIPELGISLSGSVDRIYQAGNGYGVADVKTGGSAVSVRMDVETKVHAYQVGIYELLATAASGLPISEGGLILGLQTGKAAKGQRAAISKPIEGARELLVGDGQTPGVLEMAAAVIKSGNFLGNPRSMMCHDRYCAAYSNCPFRK